MSHSKVNYRDVEPKSDGMHFLRDALDTDNLGVTVLDCEAGWSGMEHDHGDEGHEEVYLLIDGGATVSIDGDDVTLEPGDAVRIPPEATRQIRVSDEDSTLVLAGAP
ncbi:cupin domain-containing protein [Haloprofundus salinisoli]|uniref:cupin domain-containing protein n=1 Tax=Haloprofundus salinisoli TaxID=2876193 RepID=UPI001CCB71CE|nr:cupin domain-containing protein [Haloprofundus salinisoli]